MKNRAQRKLAEIQKFDEWLRNKVKNVHTSNDAIMYEAYCRIEPK